MPINRVWVLAEAFDGKPLTISLELLTAARGLASTVEAVVWGADGEAIAGELGKFGATKVYNAGDIGQQLPGTAIGGALAAAISGGDAPDAILIPATYDGRDIAGRLSAKIDRPVLTNVVGLTDDGGKLVSEHAIFGGNQILKAAPTEGPGIYVVRAKSFPAEESGGGAPEVAALAVPDTGAAGAAQITERHVEERTGPKLDEAAVVVSGGRGLGEAAKYEMIE